MTNPGKVGRDRIGYVLKVLYDFAEGNSERIAEYRNVVGRGREDGSKLLEGDASRLINLMIESYSNKPSEWDDLNADINHLFSWGSYQNIHSHSFMYLYYITGRLFSDRGNSLTFDGVPMIGLGSIVHV